MAGEGIRVNAVRPGYIFTDFHALSGDPYRVSKLESGIPMGRGGVAEEVAEAIVWLLSEKLRMQPAHSSIWAAVADPFSPQAVSE